MVASKDTPSIVHFLKDARSGNTPHRMRRVICNCICLSVSKQIDMQVMISKHTARVSFESHTRRVAARLAVRTRFNMFFPREFAKALFNIPLAFVSRLFNATVRAGFDSFRISQLALQRSRMCSRVFRMHACSCRNISCASCNCRSVSHLYNAVVCPVGFSQCTLAFAGT